MDLNEIGKMIEASLEGLKIDVAEARGDKPGQWAYKMSDSTIWIDVYDLPAKPGVYYMRVLSPLMAMPDKKVDEFLQDLLEINFKLFNAAMAKKGDWIYLINLRQTQDLNQTEIDSILDQIAFYSSDYYAKLSFKYEGCWLPKTTEAGGTPGPAQ
jgi:hypothetical protein